MPPAYGTPLPLSTNRVLIYSNLRESHACRCPPFRELLSSTGVSRYHNSDSMAWKRIAVSLANEQGPTRQVIEEGKGDARELKTDLRSKRAGKARFPQLRGPKIAPMWIRLMAAPGGAVISHMETIPMAVDVQVRRVTESLGVTDTRSLLPTMFPVGDARSSEEDDESLLWLATVMCRRC